MTAVRQSPDHDSLVYDELATALERLSCQLRGRLCDASVSLHQGGVVLRGRTQSYYVKQLAQHAVMTCVSVPIFANEIEVS